MSKQKSSEADENPTIQEIRLCRKLVASIKQIVDQYGNVVPDSVLNEYKKLKEFYESRNWIISDG